MVSFTFSMQRHLIWLASAPFTLYRLAKFGWVPFADLRVRSLAMKQNAEFTEGVKLWSHYKPFLDRSLQNCGTT